MEKIKIKFKKLNEEAKAPFYATIHSAGCDFYSTENIILIQNETKKISTGIALEIPEGFYLRIEDRSGLAVKGIHHLGGIIDSDYRGEVFIVLHNSSNKEYKIEKGDRVAQGILTPVSQANFEQANELSQTKRGEGGFHSTGRK